MAKFKSQYQTLTVLDEDGSVMGVFEGGEFETDDEDVAERLRAFEDVEEVGGGSAGAEGDLESETVADLQQIASAEGVTGYSNLNKADLIQAIRDNRE